MLSLNLAKLTKPAKKIKVKKSKVKAEEFDIKSFDTESLMA